MIPINGPILVVLAVTVLGYLIVPPLAHGIEHAGHAVCHVVTLGHHCK